MSSLNADAERIRAMGMFDLQDTLPGLLSALADFFTRHRVAAPVGVTWRQDPSRGWQAEIELTAADYLRIVEGYPMPTAVRTAGDQLHLETELRAARLVAHLPLAASQAHISGGALVVGLSGASASTPSPAPGARAVFGQRGAT
jgi:hypothetical protein